MRRPAPIKPWLSAEDLQIWVREAKSRGEYQKRLAIWLTFIGPYPAHQVAMLLGVSKQAVWLWVSQYNQRGPEGSGASRARRTLLGVSFLGRGRSFLGPPSGARSERSGSHRLANLPSTLPSHGQEAFLGLCLSSAASASLAQAGSPASSGPVQPSTPRGIQKNSLNSSKKP